MTPFVQGQLDGLLLAVLAHGPAHGYAVMEALRARSGGTLDVPEGSVYPALHRLEEGGLLASAWEDAAGRSRRVYSLTRRGRTALAAHRRDWQVFTAAVARVLEPGWT